MLEGQALIGARFVRVDRGIKFRVIDHKAL